MPELSRADVEHLANLARIDLTDDERNSLVGELSVILDAVATVQQAPVDDVEPMSHPMPLVNVTRTDQLAPGLSAEQALAAAPASEHQRFSVPRILAED